MRNQDKIRGSLIGGAAGDALGYAVEFMTLQQIKEQYGNDGITEYTLKNGKVLISDDTQMTLFTANGVLIRTTRGMIRGIAADSHGYCWKCYEGWLKTQNGNYKRWSESVDDITREYPWLIRVPELHSSRAPGNTVLHALRGGKMGELDKPLNSSKGCGGLMRVAPIGLYFEKEDPERVARYGADNAALTHGHPLGWLPAAAFVYILHRIMYSEEQLNLKNVVLESLEVTRTVFPETDYLEEFVDIMNKAVKLSASDIDDETAVKSLGEGWVAEETLAISVYCALKYHDDFEKAIITSVNHSGDSDSTGSVCGNIMGAVHGYENIPEKFKKNLELKDLILEMADDLYNDCQIDEYTVDKDEAWYYKYIV